MEMLAYSDNPAHEKYLEAIDEFNRLSNEKDDLLILVDDPKTSPESKKNAQKKLSYIEEDIRIAHREAYRLQGLIG